LPHMHRGGRLLSTLIFSPPGCGKTTVLRDAARQASYGLGGLAPCRVCIVDTRYELAGGADGLTQLDLGPRTDVLSGVGKAAGMRMMICNMAPDLLVTDELGTAAEALAAREALCCGVTLLASAHAGSLGELAARPAMRSLFIERVFERYILLSRERGRIAAAYDGDLRPLRPVESLCSAS
ncbi:MAG: stage III sporulation protein AA, partial [Clostridia bacterium]|nr:stage III sporulation protein AA [Clostridia bacterium]